MIIALILPVQRPISRAAGKRQLAQGGNELCYRVGPVFSPCLLDPLYEMAADLLLLSQTSLLRFAHILGKARRGLHAGLGVRALVLTTRVLHRRRIHI